MIGLIFLPVVGICSSIPSPISTIKTLQLVLEKQARNLIKSKFFIKKKFSRALSNFGCGKIGGFEFGI